jgi:hypothetical protein
MSAVRKVSELSTSNIVFSELKKQGSGSNVVYINYKHKEKMERLIFQTPKMFVPFGASTFKNENSTQPPKYSVRFSLDKKVGGVKELAKFLEDLDKLVCKKAVENKAWYQLLGMKSSKVSKEKVEVLYNSIVKESTNEKYPDAFNTKVPFNYQNNSVLLTLFDKSKQKLDVTLDNIEQLLPKLSEMKALVQVSHIWFIGKKFGVTLKLVQGVVYKKESLSGYSMLEDSDDEDEKSDEESDEEDESDEESD